MQLWWQPPFWMLHDAPNMGIDKQTTVQVCYDVQSDSGECNSIGEKIFACIQSVCLDGYNHTPDLINLPMKISSTPSCTPYLPLSEPLNPRKLDHTPIGMSTLIFELIPIQHASKESYPRLEDYCCCISTFHCTH